MFKLATQSQGEGRWFTAADLGITGADFRVRIRPIGRIGVVNAASRNMTVNPGQDTVLGLRRIEMGNVRADLFCQGLVAWENVLGEDGKPVPCTDEIKRVLFDNADFDENTRVFVDAVNAKIDTMAVAAATAEEAEAKNCESSGPGDSAQGQTTAGTAGSSAPSA